MYQGVTNRGLRWSEPSSSEGQDSDPPKENHKLVKEDSMYAEVVKHVFEAFAIRAFGVTKASSTTGSCGRRRC